MDAAIARRIRLVGMDVDGTLTDGGLYIGTVPRPGDGEPVRVEFKRFDIQDGMGMALARCAGLRLAIVTGRAGTAARLRAEELKVDDFVISGARKLPAFEELLQRHGMGWDEAAFVGDDLIDLPIMRRVALPVAVANAVPEVKAAARFTTSATGGRGAVREFLQALLETRGDWKDTVETYLKERGDDDGR